MYKLIATDLDGTLLRSDKSISKETIDTLIQLDKLGVAFLPSTGRTQNELPEAIAKLPFLRYSLCANGGILYDYQTKSYIHEITIPNQRALDLLEYSKQLEIYPSLVMDGKRYMQGDQDGNIIPEIIMIYIKL